MNKYYLVVLPDGDIEIRKENIYLNSIEYEIVTHKSYNMGEKLEDNVLYMLGLWSDYIMNEYKQQALEIEELENDK